MYVQIDTHRHMYTTHTDTDTHTHTHTCVHTISLFTWLYDSRSCEDVVALSFAASYNTLCILNVMYIHINVQVRTLEAYV